MSHVFKRKTDHDELQDRFHALGYEADTLANSILAIVVGATVELSQCKLNSSYYEKESHWLYLALLAFVHLVNFFLDENKPTDVQTLSKNARFDTKTESALQSLVLEALRESLESVIRHHLTSNI